MVIHDLNVVGSFFRPAEADSKLVIDPNGVLSSSVTPFSFSSRNPGRERDFRDTAAANWSRVLEALAWRFEGRVFLEAFESSPSKMSSVPWSLKETINRPSSSPQVDT